MSTPDEEDPAPALSTAIKASSYHVMLHYIELFSLFFIKLYDHPKH